MEEMITDEELMGSEDAMAPEMDEMSEEEVSMAGSTPGAISLTVDDLPDLADKQIGDEIVLKVSGISEDGTYQLSIGGIEETNQEDVLVEGNGGSAANDIASLL